MDQCFDTVMDVHKQLKTGKYCLNCNIGTGEYQLFCRNNNFFFVDFFDFQYFFFMLDLIDEPGFDVFGQSIGSIPSENVRCSHCDRLVMASR